MRWLEDFAVGDAFETPPEVVPEADIVAFARRYDPQPFHLDREAGERSVFGGLVASGWHTAALTMGLLVRHSPDVVGGIVGLGVEELRWGPLRPDDAIRVHVEVVSVRRSASRTDRGIVRLRVRTLNQRDEEVQHFVVSTLVLARAPEGGAA